MSDSVLGPSPGELDTPIRRLRLLSRLAIALLLDVIEIARGGRHMIDALLIAVIVQANRGGVADRSDFQVAYGGSANVTPDDRRRPIAINALAASLGLPFETVRRRVRNLSEAGVCRTVSGGVIVPSAVLGLLDEGQKRRRAYERVRAFFYEVSDLGLMPELAPPSAHLGANADPLATTILLTAEYVLREIAGLLETMGGPVDGLIAFEIFRANTAHFPHHFRGGEGYGAQDMVDDSHRRPISAAAVAALVGMPEETVRRHIVRLIDRGVCQRVRDGVIMPAAVYARADVREAIFANAANLRRLFAGLSRFGVLQQWERLRQAA